MGLDMYLNRVPKVETLDELKVINNRLDAAFLKGAEPFMAELKAIKNERSYIYDIEMTVSPYVDLEKYAEDKEGWGNIISIESRCCYWRKFNALHGWMVENVQGGVDNCGEYIVTEKHLKALLEALGTVNNEETEFEPRGGFFFGGTEKDEYYYARCEELKSTITYLLTQGMHDTIYIYSSSW